MMPKPVTVMDVIREMTFQNPGRRVVIRHPSIGDTVVKNIKVDELVSVDEDIDEDEIASGDSTGEIVEKIVVIEVE